MRYFKFSHDRWQLFLNFMSLIDLGRSLLFYSDNEINYIETFFQKLGRTMV